ncbi:hypothetical protein [Anaeromassilibacillus sp. SJQ-1]|uniref:hypothetical protein n=1 Tax=Anaeromassilibacillus sp. SJQ-1 TaxID=3375419 RepID=UPI0006C7ACCA
MQEIERKFLLSEFPDLPLLEKAETFQGYLSVEPVVRIRKKVKKIIRAMCCASRGKGGFAGKRLNGT